MSSAVEKRKRRLSLVKATLDKDLERGPLDFEKFVKKVMLLTGVTQFKAREYLSLIIESYDYKLEQTTPVKRYEKGVWKIDKP